MLQKTLYNNTIISKEYAVFAITSYSHKYQPTYARMHVAYARTHPRTTYKYVVTYSHTCTHTRTPAHMHAHILWITTLLVCYTLQ